MGAASARLAEYGGTEPVVRIIWIVAIAFTLCLGGCGPSDAPEPAGGPGQPPPGNTLDPAQVPENLRHLTPLAAQWGIGDDLERMEAIERSSFAEREELATAMAPYHADITAWLDSFGAGPMSDEAAAFMYMQLALEEFP